jgi:hypothetical protein
MAKVYEQSYRDISALAASDNSDSFFAKRDGRTFIPPKCRYRRFSVAWQTFRTTEEALHTWRDVEYGPLNERGWVLQERLLSKRILHFGNDQIFWECQETQVAESYQREHADVTYSEALLSPGPWMRFLPILHDTDRPRANQLGEG